MEDLYWVSICGLRKGFCRLLGHRCMRSFGLGSEDVFVYCHYFETAHPMTRETYREFRRNRWNRRPGRKVMKLRWVYREKGNKRRIRIVKASDLEAWTTAVGGWG